MSGVFVLLYGYKRSLDSDFAFFMPYQQYYFTFAQLS